MTTKLKRIKKFQQCPTEAGDEFVEYWNYKLKDLQRATGPRRSSGTRNG
jgi:hypothetical protein